VQGSLGYCQTAVSCQEAVSMMAGADAEVTETQAIGEMLGGEARDRKTMVLIVQRKK
jgi:hypothetical protein